MDSISEIIKKESEKLDEFPDKKTKTKQKSNKNTKDKMKEQPVPNVEEKLKQEKNKDDDTKKNNQQELKQQLTKINQNLVEIKQILQENKSNNKTQSNSKTQKNDKVTIEKEIEGVFAGSEMVGSDGNRYQVPGDYINENKLVEGDLLKLIIKSDESFKFEQAGSVKRKRVVGKLIQKKSKWKVQAEGETYKLPQKQVKIYKPNEGDKIVVMTPQTGKSSWATIENIF